jgi:hypothetical protein
MLLVSHNVQQRSHDVSVVRSEHEFSVLEVRRVDATTVMVIIEQAAREGPCPECGVFSGITGRSFTAPQTTPHAGQGPSLAVCSMITFTADRSSRCTSRTPNSSSRPNNTDAASTDVASDILVASLLDVVEDQQHVGATSPSLATTRASKNPA